MKSKALFPQIGQAGLALVLWGFYPMKTTLKMAEKPASAKMGVFWASTLTRSGFCGLQVSYIEMFTNRPRSGERCERAQPNAQRSLTLIWVSVSVNVLRGILIEIEGWDFHPPHAEFFPGFSFLCATGNTAHKQRGLHPHAGRLPLSPATPHRNIFPIQKQTSKSL